MPYGIPSEAGGDNKANVSKMERCVQKLMASGKSKEKAIAICRSSLGFTKDGASSHQHDMAAMKSRLKGSGTRGR